MVSWGVSISLNAEMLATRRLLRFLPVGCFLGSVVHGFLCAPFPASSKLPNAQEFSARRLEQFSTQGKSSTSLQDVANWRSNSLEKNRTVLILPVPLDQTILPGQSQTVIWNEGRQLDLLEESISNHYNVVSVASINDGTDASDDGDATTPSQQGMFACLALCEIVKYSVDAGFRGRVTATVTLRCVSRAKLVEVSQSSPMMMGKCYELSDDIAPSTDEIKQEMEICEDIVKDILQLTEDNNDYQAAFWQALAALDYDPTTMLTRYPLATNTRKEVEAVSWGAISLLQDPSRRYQGFASTSLLYRLQMGRNSLLREQLLGLDYKTTMPVSSGGNGTIPIVDDGGILDTESNEGFQ